MGRLFDWCVDIWDGVPGGKAGRYIFLAIVLYILAAIPLGIYWSYTPARFDPVAESSTNAQTQQQTSTTGYVTVYTQVSEFSLA